MQLLDFQDDGLPPLVLRLFVHVAAGPLLSCSLITEIPIEKYCQRMCNLRHNMLRRLLMQ